MWVLWYVKFSSVKERERGSLTKLSCLKNDRIGILNNQPPTVIGWRLFLGCINSLELVARFICRVQDSERPFANVGTWKLGIDIFGNFPFQKCGKFLPPSWANATCLPGLYSIDCLLLYAHTSQIVPQLGRRNVTWWGVSVNGLWLDLFWDDPPSFQLWTLEIDPG